MNTETISWPAPAKLNLFLYINGKREDGYHELQTLFQFIDCCDFLTITPNHSGQITISPTIEGLTVENNLIYKAAMRIKTKAPNEYGAHIKLNKQLPMGGGLGGGSSDAATTLVALNYHWQLGLSQEALSTLGVSLGADVPIFIFGEAAIAEGVGEVLTPVTVDEPFYLISAPNCHVSTPAVFQNKHLTRDTAKKSHEQLLCNSWHNDCQPCVKNHYPEVANAIDWLIEYAPTRLTGTGACVFSTYSNLASAQQVLQTAPSAMNCFIAKGLNKSPLSELLATLN